MRERRAITRAAAMAAAEQAAAILSRDPRVRLVYPFGSAADPEAHTRLWRALGERLEERRGSAT